MKITTHQLSTGYRSSKGVVTVGEQIDLTVTTGQTICLLGPNGCGKTTLFRTVLGLLKPLAGQVCFDDRDITELSRMAVAQRIAYVPQSHTPPFAFDAIEIVMMGRTAHLSRFGQPGPKDWQAAHEAMRQLGIESLAHSNYIELSGGQRQLVLIARALAQETDMIVMDEPTASLDFGNQARLLSHIAGLTREAGRSVVLSTHNPDQAFALQADVAVMKAGRLLASGPAADTLTAELLSHVYDTGIRVETTRDGALRCHAVLAASGSASGSNESNSAFRSSSR